MLIPLHLLMFILVYYCLGMVEVFIVEEEDHCLQTFHRNKFKRLSAEYNFSGKQLNSAAYYVKMVLDLREVFS